MEKDSGYQKQLVNSEGQNDEHAIVTATLNAQRRVDINKLVSDATALNNDPNSGLNFNKNFTSAQFALSMVEGVDRVRFIMG